MTLKRLVSLFLLLAAAFAAPAYTKQPSTHLGPVLTADGGEPPPAPIPRLKIVS